jgi:hypothetical protein
MLTHTFSFTPDDVVGAIFPVQGYNYPIAYPIPKSATTTMATTNTTAIITSIIFGLFVACLLFWFKRWRYLTSYKVQEVLKK